MPVAKLDPANDIAGLIKDVPDFPKKGIVFKDITPLLAAPEAFAAAVDRMAAPFLNAGIHSVAGIESRGFLLAAPIARALKAGIVPIRKKGKLPRRVKSASYDLEYGQDSIEAHEDAFPAGAKVLLVDDVLATGGTAKAACELIEKIGGTVVGACFLIELGFLNGRAKLPGRDVRSLVKY
jgi:adenine phosphoribosyltransferase